MSDSAVDFGRRNFLIGATTVTGVVGAGMAAWPFISSLIPSARAQALGAAVEVDVSKLEPGAMLRAEWRGAPIYVVNRTQVALDSLEAVTGQLRDPNSEQSDQPPYAQNEYRSIRPQIWVGTGVCTHLGCAPLYRPEVAAAGLGADWQGGFFCPCHGSKFDLAGRVYSGVPAPLNLVVPPHRFLSDSVLLIGDDTGAAS